MKNKQILKGNENNEHKKYKKSLLKYNTEYNKNKNNFYSFISKRNIIAKINEEKDEITKNKSNKNIISTNKNLGLKKNLTSLVGKMNTNLKIKNFDSIIKAGPYLHRRSINYNNNNRNKKNMSKQLFINDIIPNNNKLKLNQIKNSFIKSIDFNTSHISPHQRNKESNISLNSHSQKNKNKNYRKIINSNLNVKNFKKMKKNNTEIKNNFNTVNCRRNSCKSNENIKKVNSFKIKNNLSSSAHKQKKKYSSLVMRANLNNPLNHRNSTLISKINYDIFRKVNMFELDYDMENNISEINYAIGNFNSNDFALCNSNSSMEEIYNKLVTLCKEKELSLAKIESNKFICKKDGDNSIKIEINKRGKTNVLKLYYLNGKESVTKEIIKEIILRIGF